MQTPPFPANESERLASLRKMILLDTPDEEAFDRITRLAAAMFRAPIALISLVDQNRQWFKSCIGLSARETGRDISFCGHAILNNQVFVIPDAREDTRFADNPLVVGEPYIRFYAGKPLKNDSQHNIGTLCIISPEPRNFSAQDIGLLEDLGRIAEEVFRARQLANTQLLLIEELDYSKRQHLIDKLLRIWNREGTSNIIKREIEIAVQQAGKLSVFVLQLTGYKTRIDQNNALGAHDFILDVVKQLRRQVPPQVAIGRYADATLAICWPGIAGKESEQILSALQANLCRLSESDQPDRDIAFTVISLDAATFHQQFEASDVLSAIDQFALFRNIAHSKAIESLHFD